MKQYLDLLGRILDQGKRKENRTGTDTLAVFGHQMRFDLRQGFPLVTTKKVHIKSVIYELFWMLNGDTRLKFLNDNGVSIWDEWGKEDYLPQLGYEAGELGPVYGQQWRAWTALPRVKHEGKFYYSLTLVDQIEAIVDKLIHNPNDRRMILSAWNVGDLDQMKLPPCHCFSQFDVTEARLSCHMYIRSWDVFLGGPFNIAQYGFLTHMLAHTAGLDVGELVISSGDTHLYVNHLEQVKTQLGREPHLPPRLTIKDLSQDVRSRHHGKEGVRHMRTPFQFEDFLLTGYVPHPGIKAEVAV